MIQFAPYRELFKDRQLFRIVISSLVPRLSAGLNGLGITILLQSLYGSLSTGGMVSAGYLVALGVASPMIGRYIDQKSPKRVLLPLGLINSAFLACLVTAALWRVSVPWLFVLAICAGLSYPPVSMITRAMWRKSDLPDTSKQLGYALEGVIMESVFVLGPLILSLFIWLESPASALYFSAASMALGVILYQRSGALSRWGQVELAKRHWLGPLKVTGVRRAITVSMLLGATFALQEVGMIARTKAAGIEWAVGWMFAAYSVPSALAGLIYGTRQFQISLNHQIAIGMAWVASMSAALALSPNLWVFGLTCAFCGMGVGPILTANQLQLGRLTPVEYSTEAFTWSATVFMVTLGLVFWAGSLASEHWGPNATLWLALGTGLAGFIAALRVPQIYHHA